VDHFWRATLGQFWRALKEGATIFNNHILRSRINYQLTRELSLRGIVDYTAVLADGSLVALQRRKGLSTDVLLTYLLNPGTALYIGYNDRYQNVQIDPAGTDPAHRFPLPCDRPAAVREPAISSGSDGAALQNFRTREKRA
jgi:hypothetical protein